MSRSLTALRMGQGKEELWSKGHLERAERGGVIQKECACVSVTFPLFLIVLVIVCLFFDVNVLLSVSIVSL